MSIGIFDSGIGGLTVFKEIAKEFPKADIYYLGDTARVPYGNKSKETIIRYSIECADFLVKNFDVDILIVACNTASSHALDTLKKYLQIPVIGVVIPGAEMAVKTTKNKKVGVIGTIATIRSNAYKEAIEKLDKDIELYQKACPLFVPLVEEGMIDNQIAELVIKEYLQEIIDKGIDTLILGCTHYPLLKDTIKNIYPDISIVDSSQNIVSHIKNLKINTEENSIRHIYITDESPAFEKLKNLLVPEGKTEKIELSQICNL